MSGLLFFFSEWPQSHGCDRKYIFQVEMLYFSITTFEEFFLGKIDFLPFIYPNKPMSPGSISLAAARMRILFAVRRWKCRCIRFNIIIECFHVIAKSRQKKLHGNDASQPSDTLLGK